MHPYPRGIAPDLLVAQVKNTAPYVFAPDYRTPDGLGTFPPVAILRDFSEQLAAGNAPDLSHFEYFRLCLSAHYTSCATPVPTDVDIQIRQKLWPAKLPLEVALEMAELVLASRTWDYRHVSARWTVNAQGDWVGGNTGEWFTVSCGAYCALTQYQGAAAAEAMRTRLRDAIADEVHHHSEVFGSLWKSGSGVGCLQASASLAHNFGDLDRVMDMWHLSVADPLRLRFYKLGVVPFDADQKLRYLGRLWVAGELYKSEIVVAARNMTTAMAAENHRHFALRKPRALRQSRDLLVPIGPFFDHWGRTVARALQSTDGRPSEQTREIVSALKHGWDRVPKSVGYGRALMGMFDVHPELQGQLESEGLPAGDYRRAIFDVPLDRFEKRLNDEALRLMDEIPSRAE